MLCGQVVNIWMGAQGGLAWSNREATLRGWFASDGKQDWMCVGADIEGSQTNSKHQMKCFVFMFQPSETDAVMLTAMTYFEFQQLTSLWRFLKNKSHSLNSAKLEHCDTWRKFKVLAPSAVPYCSTVTFCSGWLPSHGHLNPSLPVSWFGIIYNLLPQYSCNSFQSWVKQKEAGTQISHTQVNFYSQDQIKQWRNQSFTSYWPRFFRAFPFFSIRDFRGC